MRVLIAYDASPGSDCALADLARAWLPEPVEARIATIAEDPWPAPGAASSASSFGTGRGDDRSRLAVEHARAIASRGVERTQRAFPTWRTESVVVAGDAADALLDVAADWKPDLVVVGSHGRSASVDSPVLGSVGRRVVAEAPCSVRVGQAHRAAPGGVRLVVGYDLSESADAAVAAVAARRWPSGSSAHVLVAVDPVVAHADRDPASGGVPWKELRSRAADCASKLRAAGLEATSDVVTGDARRTLVEHAAAFGADAIVIGARGLGGSHRPLVGSVAAAVVENAPCSVEVVRPREPVPASA